MTDKKMTTYMRSLGLTMRKRDGEYRVNIAGAGEGTAYYTDDRDDALDTGREMAGVGRAA